MNITEFAEKAGVSKSAVSRYFNGGYLSEEKRLIIDKAIEDTGYTPNVIAHNNSRRITRLVGIIIPKLSSESCSKVVDGITQILKDAGYQLLIINSANNASWEIQALELLRNNRVDGVILLATVFTMQHATVLRKMQIPVIIVGQKFKGYSCVCHDDYGAAYALTELMLDKGRKKPACICAFPEDREAGAERRSGFENAVKDNDIELNPSFVMTAHFTIESGYHCASVLFSNPLDMPDCLFCATDNMALGAMRFLVENRIKVPKEVMIASVGDSSLCNVAAVTLTSAHLHYRTAGIEAANMLLTAIKKGEPVQRTINLDYEIVERNSTKG